MNRCPECNKRLRRDPNSCPRCGWKKAKFNFPFFKKKQATGVCQNCGKVFYNNETKCVRCGWKVKNYRAGIGLILFSFFLPPFARRYADAIEQIEPRKAMDCRIWTRVGKAFYIALLIALVLFLLFGY